jgi:hypothetical protein
MLSVMPKDLCSPYILDVCEMGSPLRQEEGLGFQCRRLTEQSSEPPPSLSQGDNIVCFEHLPNTLGRSEVST